MSWDGWTQTLTGADSGIHYAAIFGQDGNPWSQQNDTLQQADATKLLDIIRQGASSPAFGSGVALSNGSKWTLISVDDETVVLKGKEDHKEWNMVCQKTGQALIIAYDKAGSGGAQNTKTRVWKLGDSLKGSGY
jgi:hypothetical protein